MTSKLDSRDHGYDRALRAFDAGMARLGLDYLDLYLIHWPMPMRGLYVKTWRTLTRLLEERRVKAIGVSNFTPAQLDRLLSDTGILPSVNQIQLSPAVAQNSWRAYAAEHDIAVQAWAPLGGDTKPLNASAVKRLARRHHRTPAQIVLR